MTAPLIFLDTETTGLDRDDHVWEVSAVRRDPNGTESEYTWLVRHDTSRAASLPEPFRADHAARYRESDAVTVAGLVDDLVVFFGASEDYSQRPHVVGAVPSFDTERLGRLFHRHDVAVPWHHHLIDVETLAVGWLARAGADLAKAGAGMRTVVPPFHSDEVSLLVGVDPERFARHTAMGDVRWAMAIYDAVMGTPA